MTFLPIIERELRVMARSPGNYWVRSLVALVALMICVPALVSNASFYTPSMLGKGIFDGVVISAFLFTCSAVLLTAGSVANERRQGTLGLLFLTRVKSLDIVVGKLGSLGLLSLCVLLAFLPVLAIPFLAGGVTGGEAFRKAIGLLNTLFLALTAGLWVSARDRKANRALLPALWFFVALVLGPFVVQFLLRGSKTPTLGLFSPVTTLVWASDYNYRSLAAPFWLSLAAVNVLSWFFLLTGSVRLRNAACQEGVGEVVAAKAQFRPVDVMVRSRWQPGRTAAAPLEWLATRQRGLSGGLWAVALFKFVAYFWYYFAARFIAGPALGAYWAMQAPAIAVSLLTTGLLGWVASRFLLEARRTGELELLLTTPLGASSLLNTYWRMLKRLLRWPLVVIMLPSVLQILFYLFMWNGRFLGSPSFWVTNYIGLALLGALTNILAVLTTCALAIWLALRCRSYARVLIWTLLMAAGLPFGISLCGRFLSTLVPPFSSYRPAGSSSSVVISGSGATAYFILIWLPQLIIFIYLFLLFLWSRYHAISAPTASQIESFDFRGSVSSTPLWTAMRKLRHWTPQS